MMKKYTVITKKIKYQQHIIKLALIYKIQISIIVYKNQIPALGLCYLNQMKKTIEKVIKFYYKGQFNMVFPNKENVDFY